MKRIYVAGDKHVNAQAAKQILEAIEDYQGIGLSDVLNRKRPYNGQPWTGNGKRGRILIQGLTARDIRDCLVLAFYDSRPPGLPAPTSLEALPLEQMSMEAISQNLLCWIERYMGIYPAI